MFRRDFSVNLRVTICKVEFTSDALCKSKDRAFYPGLAGRIDQTTIGRPEVAVQALRQRQIKAVVGDRSIQSAGQV